MATRWVIGLSSGSSADGIDAALVEVSGAGLYLQARPAQFLHQAYGPDLRQLLQAVATGGQGNARQTSLLHRLLGEAFAAAARQVADRASLSLQKVQCVGCTGHTVWHEAEGRFPSTLGLGMQAVVAERTGVTTVADFRDRDLAAGGQGVPLMALADSLLFRHATENRVLLHLGALARVVSLPAGGCVQDVTGFEAGPCNRLLDALICHLTGGRESHDPGGRHAVQGCCLEPLLDRWLTHPYLQRRPPKSLPANLFGAEFAADAVRQVQPSETALHDLLCTATYFVVRCITDGLERFVSRSHTPQRVLLSGGGTRNGLLLHLLQQRLPVVPVEKTDAHGVPAQARKAVGTGLLAALTLDGVPANAPSATGAAGSRLLGNLTPGSTSNWTACLNWMNHQSAPALSPREW